MVEANTKVQFNLRLEKQTLDWLHNTAKAFPVTTSVNELIRQCIRDKQQVLETGSAEGSFFNMLQENT